MKKHEQAVADVFNEFLSDEAKKRHINVHTIALDGQDRDAADYLLTDQKRFALIEFKYAQIDIISEGQKDKRYHLCQLLETDAKMRALHDQCHFLAWMQSSDSRVQLNIYRHEVCNKKVFGDRCTLSCTRPSEISRVLARQFAEELFGAPATRTLSLNEFEGYLAWLMKIASRSDKSTLELLIRDRHTEDCTLVNFASIRQAYDWFENHG